MSDQLPTLLSISIVSYHSDPQRLLETLQTLSAAVECVRQARPNARIELALIENSDSDQLAQLSNNIARASFFEPFHTVNLIQGHGNVGYGRGHNLAISHSQAIFHLVLNPDVRLDVHALLLGIEFLERHAQAGLLAPSVRGEHGQLQYLCRQYPSLLVLFVRGFLPARFRHLFDRRLARYEFRDQTNSTDLLWDPPIISGCFMLFRNQLLQQLGGFDPRFFLYFEDNDLSLRAGRAAHNVYVPSVKIEHFGGGASKKGWRHIRMFCASAWTFFQKNGWKLC